MASVKQTLSEETSLRLVEELLPAQHLRANATPPFLRDISDQVDGDLALFKVDHRDGLILTRAERRLVQGDLTSARRESSPATSVHQQYSGAIEAQTLNLSGHPPEPPAFIIPAKRSIASAFTEELGPTNKVRRVENLLVPSQTLSDEMSLDRSSASTRRGPSNATANPAGTDQGSELTTAGPGGIVLTQARLSDDALRSVTSNLAVRRNVAADLANFRRLKGQIEDPAVELADEDIIDYGIDEVTYPLEEQAEAPEVPQMLARPPVALPSPWSPPQNPHHYLASFSLIQKRALASALSSLPLAFAELVEHSSLNDPNAPDLVLDAHTAIVFFPVVHLPSFGRDLMSRLGVISSSYSHLLVILEGYPASQSYGPAKTARTIANNLRNDIPMGASTSASIDQEVFSHPIVLAMKRFRRELAIERQLSSSSATEVVCALDVHEAALYARVWGDQAEGRCDPSWTNILWGDRAWMIQDESEVRAPAC